LAITRRSAFCDVLAAATVGKGKGGKEAKVLSSVAGEGRRKRGRRVSWVPRSNLSATTKGGEGTINPFRRGRGGEEERHRDRPARPYDCSLDTRGGRETSPHSMCNLLRGKKKGGGRGVDTVQGDKKTSPTRSRPAILAKGGKGDHLGGREKKKENALSLEDRQSGTRSAGTEGKKGRIQRASEN